MSITQKSHQEVAQEIEENLSRFAAEVKQIVRRLVVPAVVDEFQGLTGALYGYMMGIFSRIDLLSCYWRGTIASRGQTVRMVEFMGRYLCPDTEINTVAIHLWRHKLMHTSKPRVLVRDGLGTRYYWLLNWGETQMPREQHYTLTSSGGYRKLTIGLTYLVDDMIRMSQKYFQDVGSSPELQRKLSKVRVELQAQRIRL